MIFMIYTNVKQQCFNKIKNMSINTPQAMDIHKWSALLTKRENTIICSLLGRNCRTLSTTLVQLLMSLGPNHQQWSIRGIGIACLVTDTGPDGVTRNYIRVYDYVERRSLFEHRLEIGMVYNRPLDLFHTFAGADGSLVGLNFADRTEALHFGDAVAVRLLPSKPRVPVNSIKKKLTKADIESPNDFRHVLSVGWNGTTAFATTTIADGFNPTVRSYLRTIGITDEQIASRESREFIVDVINKRLSAQPDSDRDLNGNSLYNSQEGEGPVEVEVEVGVEAFEAVSMAPSTSAAAAASPPQPKPRSKVSVKPPIDQSMSRSVSTQTEPYITIESIIANKHFLSIPDLPPPSPVMANSMFY